MLAEARNSPLYRQCAQYITDPAARDAFRYFVGLLAEDPDYVCYPSRKGDGLDFRFEDLHGVQPFAFIVNKGWLLFYFRKPAFLKQQWSEAELALQFDSLDENGKGELTVKLRCMDDVQRLWELINRADGVYKPGGTDTTRIGYVNQNKQRCAGHRGRPGTDHMQLSYRMECQMPGCGHVYGANGTDVFQRKCPQCQGGAPGLPF